MSDTYSREGLRGVVFVPLTTDTESTLTYGTKKTDVVEAINLELVPQSVDPDVQYAEDVESDVLYPDPEVIGTLELKELPLATQAWMLGHTVADNGVMIKKAGDTPPYFAMGFKSKSRKTGRDYYCWLLKGRAKPISQTFRTKEGKTITRQTDKVEITFIKRTHDGEYQYVVNSDDALFAASAATFFDAPPTLVVT
jgi:phi13 family phage major tail protein